MGIGFDVQLKNADGFLEFLLANKFVTQSVEFALIEVIGGGLAGLQVMVLLSGLINATGLNRGRESFGNRDAGVEPGFDLRQPHGHGYSKNSNAHSDGNYKQ